MIVLQRMLYRSRAAGPEATGLVGLSEILGASRRNNARRGLTGMLLAHGGWFLQVLEGQKAYLDQLMADLERDSRHTGIEVISVEETDSRMFGDWTMAEARITPEAAALLQGADLGRIEAGPAYALMRACGPAGT